MWTGQDYTGLVTDMHGQTGLTEAKDVIAQAGASGQHDNLRVDVLAELLADLRGLEGKLARRHKNNNCT